MGEEVFYFPVKTASHRLVLLHGWGADAEDLIPLGKDLIKDLSMQIELVSIRAPFKHPQGIGRQWYGLFPPNWEEAEKSVMQLRDRLGKLSSKSIPLQKTVLLGFSQGGAMALSSGVNMQLGGIVGCSAYPHPELNPLKKSPPVFLTHGEEDSVVPINAFIELRRLFDQSNTAFQFKVFEGSHEIPIELYSEIQSFLNQCFS